MIKIIFQAAFGNEIKNVDISEARGAPGYPQLTINNYHYGQFVKFAGKWGLYCNDRANAELTAEDRDILIDIVTEHDKD